MRILGSLECWFEDCLLALTVGFDVNVMKLTYGSQELERRDRGRSGFSRRRRKMETRLLERVSAVAEAPS